MQDKFVKLIFLLRTHTCITDAHKQPYAYINIQYQTKKVQHENRRRIIEVFEKLNGRFFDFNIELRFRKIRVFFIFRLSNKQI